MKFKVLLLILFSGALCICGTANARVIVKETIKYYTVTGKTGKQLANSITKRGPKANKVQHAMASTHWDFDLRNPKFKVVGSKCKVTSVDIHVHLTYVYPKWTEYHTASPSLKKRWDNFMKHIIRHEKKHGKIFIDGSRGFERSLKRASGRVSKKCDDYGASLTRHLLPVIRSTNSRNQMFDRREGLQWAQVRVAQRHLVSGE